MEGVLAFLVVGLALDEQDVVALVEDALEGLVLGHSRSLFY